MKTRFKIRNYWAYSFLGLFLLTLLYTACKKQEESHGETSKVTIEDSKSWFKTNIVESTDASKATFSKTSLKDKFASVKKLDKFLKWEEAKIFNTRELNYVVIPIDQSIKPFSNRNFQALRFLVIYKDQSKAMDMNIVEVVGKKGKPLEMDPKEIGNTAFSNMYFKEDKDLGRLNANILFYKKDYSFEKGFQVIAGKWSASNFVIVAMNPASDPSASALDNTMKRNLSSTKTLGVGEEDPNAAPVSGCHNMYLIGYWYDLNTGVIDSYEVLDHWLEGSDCPGGGQTSPYGGTTDPGAFAPRGFQPLCISSIVLTPETSETNQVNMTNVVFGITDVPTFGSPSTNVIEFNLQITIPSVIANPENPSQNYNISPQMQQQMIYNAYHFASQTTNLTHGQDFFSAGAQPKYSTIFAANVQFYLQNIALEGIFRTYELNHGGQVPSTGARATTSINPQKARPAMYTNAASGQGC